MQADHKIKKQPKPGTEQSEGDQRGTHNSPFVVDTKGHKNTPEETAQAKREGDHAANVERWALGLAVANTTFTFVLMIAGIVGVRLAIGSLNILKAQTRATQDSVNALINSERAWVVIDNLGAPPLYEEAPDRPPGFSIASGTPLLVFNLKVTGATTARLLNTGARFHLVARKDEATAEPLLPDHPDYRNPGVSEHLPEAGYIKAPNEGFQMAIPLEDGPISKEQWKAINEKQLFVCAYGFVKYMDAFDQPHETRFSYVYRVSYRIMNSTATGKNVFPSQFTPGGPKDYNGYRDYQKEEKKAKPN